MGSMVSSGCATCAMVDMVCGHAMLFETWTFDSDGMRKSTSNCVFVALVMTTVVISVLEVECVIFMDVRKHIANCYIAWVTVTLESSKPTIKKKPESSTRQAFNSSSQKQLSSSATEGGAFAQEFCNRYNDVVFRIRCQRSSSIENNSTDIEERISG